MATQDEILKKIKGFKEQNSPEFQKYIDFYKNKFPDFYESKLKSLELGQDPLKDGIKSFETSSEKSEIQKEEESEKKDSEDKSEEKLEEDKDSELAKNISAPHVFNINTSKNELTYSDKKGQEDKTAKVDESLFLQDESKKKPKKSAKTIIIAILAVVIVASLAGLAYVLLI